MCIMLIVTIVWWKTPLPRHSVSEKQRLILSNVMKIGKIESTSVSTPLTCISCALNAAGLHHDLDVVVVIFVNFFRMEFEAPLIRVPYESLNKQTKATQRRVDKGRVIHGNVSCLDITGFVKAAGNIKDNANNLSRDDLLRQLNELEASIRDSYSKVCIVVLYDHI